ncbi:hypothetical protein Ae201684P_021204 [Aphanomyces euteiches]|uniref:TPX2 C-terminal domain-containing protein n=1 Tax=Aphanomyces euteiches TaxID=100861 RepID=A0A6G0X776_9STRA|nr:hypothetical protein Ae201684_007878 [Aphanomyces euteiches]KAH9067032.1 hypothetical protein Ae201684P_021204 [Aphanomyces euteiches]KAH9153923.1 hypothetical protein AeRB84_003901 [Aphanomyces euteiches]
MEDVVGSAIERKETMKKTQDNSQEIASAEVSSVSDASTMEISSSENDDDDVATQVIDDVNMESSESVPETQQMTEETKEADSSALNLQQATENANDIGKQASLTMLSHETSNTNESPDDVCSVPNAARKVDNIEDPATVAAIAVVVSDSASDESEAQASTSEETIQEDPVNNNSEETTTRDTEVTLSAVVSIDMHCDIKYNTETHSIEKYPESHFAVSTTEEEHKHVETQAKSAPKSAQESVPNVSDEQPTLSTHGMTLRTATSEHQPPISTKKSPKLSFTSRELQEIDRRRQEIEKEKERYEKFRILASHKAQATFAQEKSIKPLTLPISPDLLCAKRDFRCVGHDGPVNDPVPNIQPETLVARQYEPLKAAPIKKTEPHSPFLITAQRAKLKPIPEASASAGSTGFIQPQDLVRRDGHEPIPFVAKKTVPHSPFLITARRGHSAPPSQGSSQGVVDLASQLRQHDASRDKENVKPPTRPQAPALHSTKRSRPPVPVEDEDEIELAKQFHARPVSRRVLEGHSLPRPSKKLRVTQPQSPNLESVRRHKEYQRDFIGKIEEAIATEEKQRKFKAQPMPVYNSTSGLSRVTPMPLTEVEPFHMPGERFEELAKERIAAKRIEEEETMRKMAVVKATRILRGKQVPAPVHKPPTECQSPALAVKRRAVDRAVFDAKDKARRDALEAEAERKRQEDKRAEAAQIKAWRETLSFKHYGV